MHMYCLSLSPLISFSLKSNLKSEIKMVISLLLKSICLLYLLSILYLEMMSILNIKVYFLHAVKVCIIFFYPFCSSVSFHWEIEETDVEIDQWLMIVDSCCFVFVFSFTFWRTYCWQEYVYTLTYKQCETICKQLDLHDPIWFCTNNPPGRIYPKRDFGVNNDTQWIYHHN